MHGTQALLTGALKDKIGFDGFIVSDWNGIAQVPGCSNASCPQAIIAGIDMVMVPEDWKAFIANTTKQVEDGAIPMARIDDAVTRILRVKLRAGLFDRKPSDGRYAGKADALVHRDLARQAVRESLVLLKNERKALPLKRGQRVLVVGKSADSYANQTGGWTLTWQGTDNVNADYLNADTVLAGLREALGRGPRDLRPDRRHGQPRQVRRRRGGDRRNTLCRDQRRHHRLRHDGAQPPASRRPCRAEGCGGTWQAGGDRLHVRPPALHQ